MKTAIRCVDLFAGAGGLSIGAEQAGVHVEHAVEIDEWACQTLRANRPNCRVTQSDIRFLDNDWWRSEVQKYPDLLIGGTSMPGVFACRACE